MADFDFLPSVPQTFWGFPPFLLLTINTAQIPLGVLYLNLGTLEDPTLANGLDTFLHIHIRVKLLLKQDRLLYFETTSYITAKKKVVIDLAVL